MSNFPDDMRHENLDESEADREIEARYTKTQEIINRLIPLCRLLDHTTVDAIVDQISSFEDGINVEDFPSFHSGPEHFLDRLFGMMPDEDCPLCGTHAGAGDPDVLRQTHRYHGQKVHIGLVHKDCIMAAQQVHQNMQETRFDPTFKWWHIDSLHDFVDDDWIKKNFPSIFSRLDEKANGQFSD